MKKHELQELDRDGVYFIELDDMSLAERVTRSTRSAASRWEMPVKVERVHGGLLVTKRDKRPFHRNELYNLSIGEELAVKYPADVLDTSIRNSVSRYCSEYRKYSVKITRVPGAKFIDVAITRVNLK